MDTGLSAEVFALCTTPHLCFTGVFTGVFHGVFHGVFSSQTHRADFDRSRMEFAHQQLRIAFTLKMTSSRRREVLKQRVMRGLRGRRALLLPHSLEQINDCHVETDSSASHVASTPSRSGSASRCRCSDQRSDLTLVLAARLSGPRSIASGLLGHSGSSSRDVRRAVESRASIPVDGKALASRACRISQGDRKLDSL